jgi:hypothetical protein|tara:strand:- start:436 stop:618 length:183 start_codon:yes stop_codon:yes gene_type:complete
MPQIATQNTPRFHITISTRRKRKTPQNDPFQEKSNVFPHLTQRLQKTMSRLAHSVQQEFA